MDIPFDIYSWIDSFNASPYYQGKLLSIANWLEKLLIHNKTNICTKSIFVEIPRYIPKRLRVPNMKDLSLDEYVHIAKEAALINPDYIVNQLTLTIENGKIIENPILELNPLLAKDIKNCPQPIILIYVGILRVKGLKVRSSHGNALIIDKTNRTYELFDPYGKTTPEIDAWFNEEFREAANLENYTYLPPLELCPKSGPQYLAEKDSLSRNEKGFCMTYTFMYIHMRTANPGIDPRKIVEILLDKTPKELRRYAILYNNILNTHYGWPFRD